MKEVANYLAAFFYDSFLNLVLAFCLVLDVVFFFFAMN